MRKYTFFYNTETCQYERARINVRQVVVYVTGVICTGALFLIAILFLHNTIIETDREETLRAENRALKKNKKILKEELALIETTLENLKEQDRKLYTKLFSTYPTEEVKPKASFTKEQLLLADASGFQSLFSLLEERSKKLLQRSSHSNQTFSSKLSITANEASNMAALPSIQPLQDADINKLVSGFGNRVNPFHKGIHNHTGVDYAAPRGSLVVATASGKVVTVHKSSVQAGYGNYIDIDHGNGFVTRYAHLEESRIKAGQLIERGTVIGTVGNSGGSSAPHVHYEIILKGKPIDPVLFMLDGLSSKEHSQLVSIGKKKNQSLD